MLILVGDFALQYFTPAPGGDTAFMVRSNHIKFGRNVFAELGEDTRAVIAMSAATPTRESSPRVAVFTDARVAKLLPHFRVGVDSLRGAGIDPVVFDAVSVEPTDRSFMAVRV